VRPPKRVHLPSGLAVALEAKEALSPRGRVRGAPLFSELVELVSSGDVTLGTGQEPVDVLSLELRDFHALRAVATRLGWLAEEAVEIGCRNCGEVFAHPPCATLQLGPFVDGELDDPELDATLDLAAAHPIPTVRLRGGGAAQEVKLRAVTAREAAPLHRALRRRRLVITDRVVRALGIEALGPLRAPRAIAEVLSTCPDDAWSAIGDLFLEAHYPPRLSSVALCPKCGARNDVDAPYERELEPSRPTPPAPQSNAEVFPDLATFSAFARDAFDRLAGDFTREVRLAIDSRVPACDDGGEPLMGAYVPPGGDVSARVGTGEITLYYRTFRAMWDEEGLYDWRSEVDETIEHELDHHDGWRVGHDPMDDEERDEIAREHARLVGRKTAARASVGALGVDIAGFMARTWLIWLIVVGVTVAVTVCGRGE
jgi:hypothetical protein